jgi:LysM repeat protein
MMPGKSQIAILILCILTITSCSTSKSVRTTDASDRSSVKISYVNDYINTYSGLAVREMKRTGIPASITLAQGMLESDYGRSRLATEANNHFGIKCHNTWKGATIEHHDDKRNECFRKYRKVEESYYDHSDFLTSGSRYTSLFELSTTDYKSWARGLKKAGYATNPDYANMLIRKIEEYELWRYDSGRQISAKSTPEPDSAEAGAGAFSNGKNKGTTLSRNSDQFIVPGRVSRIKENNRIQYIVVADGDTRQSIEKDFGLLGWELSKYNELDKDFIISPGQILYFQPKRDKAEPGKDVHTAGNGDTMYSISQKYGIKLKKLYEMNRMNDGQEPSSGDKIWLRQMKPVN